MPAPLPAYTAPNEMQGRILRLLAAGHTQEDAGRRVYLTRSGVRWHLDSLRRQWALRSVPQLLILAGQLGWIGVGDRAWRLVPPREPGAGKPKGEPRRWRHAWKGGR